LSYSSSCLSASEFFDAEEHHDSRESPTDEATGLPFEEAADGDGDAGQLSDTSSEAGSLSSEEGSVSSENSEIATEEFNAVDNCECMAVNFEMAGGLPTLNNLEKALNENHV